MNVSVDTVSETNLANEVQGVMAEVTRYPLEILDVDADLEADLGIDSVKLGEVFSVLRERYQLPAQMDLPREQLRSIAGISRSLEAFISGIGPDAPETPGDNARSPQQSDDSQIVSLDGQTEVRSDESSPDLTEVIRGIFAEVTRYPGEILDTEADLEADLGIDSVKLGEVFSVLREKYDLPSDMDMPRDRLRTIAGISGVLGEYLGGAVVTESPARGTSTDARGEWRYAAPEPAGTSSGGEVVHASDDDAYRYPLKDRVVLVTGSGRGMGRDIASYLSELGAKVVVNSFHSRHAGEETAAGIRERGGDAIHLWGSMANPDHIDNVFSDIEDRYGVLDFYVANASNGMLARLEDITVEHWEKAYRTNVVGLHQCAIRAARLMRKRGGGKIITLSSPASQGYVEYFGAMGTVKAAVESLTRSMAIEFARDNIQVNCISPGPVYGDLLDKWPDSERLIAQWESNTAYERLCEARDVSHLIGYMLSDKAKMFNGSVLVMDGGISISGF